MLDGTGLNGVVEAVRVSHGHAVGPARVPSRFASLQPPRQLQRDYRTLQDMNACHAVRSYCVTVSSPGSPETPVLSKTVYADSAVY